MKKILFVTTISLLMIHFVSAQATRFGFTVGLTMANMTEKNDAALIVAPVTDRETGDFRFGPTIGLVLDVPMEKNGSFQPGLNFVQKGTRNISSTGAIKTITSSRLSYLEMPLNIIFDIRRSNGKLRIGGGPAAGMGLSGKTTTVTNNVSKKEKIKFGSNTDDDLKGVDFSINGIIGYEFTSGGFVYINYSHGISTLLIGGGDKSLFNSYFGLRLGYLLKCKTKTKK